MEIVVHFVLIDGEVILVTLDLQVADVCARAYNEVRRRTLIPAEIRHGKLIL